MLCIVRTTRVSPNGCHPLLGKEGSFKEIHLGVKIRL